MAYKTTKNVFIDGEIVETGKTVELDDKQIATLLERGAIVEFDPNAPDEVPAKPEIPGQIVEEFELNGVDYKAHQYSGRNGNFLFSSQGDLISEAAFTSAKQTLVKQELDAERSTEAEQVAPAAEPQTQELEETTIPVTDGPTQQQLEQDMQLAEGGDQPQTTQLS